VITYWCIQTYDDVPELQCDLDALSEWAVTWLMTFNFTTCEYLTSTNKQSFINSVYKIRDVDYVLQQVTSTKYLGITISHNLSRPNHIAHICSKSNSVLTFL